MSIRTPHHNVPTTPTSAIDRESLVDSIRRSAGPHLLSTIWISVLLSMLFRDVHEYLRDGFIAELATDGTVYGTEVTATTLLVSGFVLQLPLAMLVLTKVLPRRVNRVANIVVAIVMAAGVAGTWPKDSDDIVFGIAQLIALAAIVIICRQWRDSADADLESPRPLKTLQ